MADPANGDAPATGRLAERRTRLEHRALALSSGLLDREWIGLQLGRALADDRAAAEALVAADESDGPVSPHPLVELAWARPGQPWLREGVPSIVWWLRARNRRETMPPHPLVDVRETSRRDPDALRHPGGPLGAWLAGAGPASVLVSPEGLPPITLGEARAAALSAQRGWTALTTPTAPPPAARAAVARPAPDADPASPTVSVVVVARDAATTLRATITSLQHQRLTAWEAVVVDDGSCDDTAAVLAGLAHFEPRVVVLGADDPGTPVERALAAARGRHVCFVEAGRTLPPGLLGDLAAALDADPRAPAVLAAGAGASGVADPARLLADGSLDAARVLARRDLVVALGGPDPDLGTGAGLDLVLRLVDGGGLARVATAAPTGAPSAAPSPRLLDRHLVDWRTSAPARPGSTSLVVLARDGVVATTRWLLRAMAGSPFAEVLVVAGRPTRVHHVVASSLAALAPAGVGCHVVAPAVGSPTAANLGLTRVTGERVVVVGAEVDADLADLLALADVLDAPGVAVAQPLVVGTDGAVVSAGAAFATTALRPEPWLAGHAVRDVPAGTTRVAAPLAPVVALRRDLAERLGGFDAAYAGGLAEVELGLRAVGRGEGDCVLAASVVVSCAAGRVVGPARLAATVELLEAAGPGAPTVGPEVWGQAGFEVVGVRNEALRPVATESADDPAADPLWLPRAVLRPVPPRAERIAQSPPRLRWSIDTAVPAGPGGASWGDLHFAEALAAALERRGQHVAVDAREARLRPGRDHDDVVLVLRGLDRVVPRPGPLHLAWVISHPDLVAPAELAAYDAVFAASLSWSARTTAAWGVPVTPLLQCTDPSLFHPGRASGPASEAAGPVLFVGNSRGVMRTSLRAALDAGADVEVHGKGWKEFLGLDRVASLSIPNADLGRHYADASVVLNDHWADMRREGFVSNRLFDAAACGARVLSDEIAGGPDLLGPLLRTFDPGSPDGGRSEVAAVLADPDAAWGDRDARLARASVIAAEHSFDARAATLLDAAAALLRP